MIKNKTKDLVLNVQDIHKSYGTGENKNEVLKGISFELSQGQILALLGANGAGKTTLVKILSTLSKADSGKVQVAGFDLERQPEKVRESIGLTGQFAAVDEELTAKENLVFFGGLQGLDKNLARQRADDLLKIFRLDQVGDQLVREYSGGMKRRLDIAISIVVSPKLLFLDEPTTGLDPVSRREVWDMVKYLKEAGVSVLLTTQYLEEADELADEIIILNNGKIALQGSPSYIKENYASPQCKISFNSNEDLENARDILLVSGMDLDKDQIIIKGLDLTFNTNKGVEDLKVAIDLLDQAEVKVRLIALQPASLESIFVDIAYEKEQLGREV